MTHRRGFTLVELMIAMGASTALLAVSLGMIHRTMTLHTTARQQDALQQTAARLSRQLRNDLHRAQSVELTDGTLKLTFPEAISISDLTYTISANGVLREQPQESGATHRDEFRFPNCSSIEAELSEPSRIELTVLRDGLAKGMPATVVLRLEAVVGRRARLHAADGAATASEEAP